MSFLALPARARSLSTPPRPTGVGPMWLSSVLPTPPDSDNNEDEATPLRKRPARHFAAFDLGFIRLTSESEPQSAKQERCYEELEEEPEIHVPCVKLKDGRELRPLLKHRKRSASHHIPNSAKWRTSPSPPPSESSLPSANQSPERETMHEHAHVHFSETLENVCVFDESAPAHDSDPTHSPLEPPRVRAPQPSPSPRIKTRQLRLPSTVIASPSHRAALGFDSSENSPSTPRSASPPSHGRDMQLTLACDSSLPSAENAPAHGMVTTLGVGLSPTRDALTGLVRVRNISFEKHVSVVFTGDEWHTRKEADAHWTDAYKPDSEDKGELDVSPRPDGYDDFEFSIPLGDLGIKSCVGTAVRARFLRFAIKYEVPGKGEWWDNRDGQNWTARFRAVALGL